MSSGSPGQKPRRWQPACADNTYGEIAVVNNADTAIGPAVVADFEIEMSHEETGTTVCPGLATRLVDRSTGDPEQWVWKFPDGTTLTDQNPQLPHGVVGDVTLTVFRGGDTSTTTKVANFVARRHAAARPGCRIVRQVRRCCPLLAAAGDSL